MTQVYLLDRFRIHHDDGPEVRLEAQKARELFAFLLLQPNRRHVRELVASRMWGNACTTSDSRAYLRKALWKLQTFLRDALGREGGVTLATDGRVIGVDEQDALWVDVHEFEAAYDAVRHVRGPDLPASSVDRVRKAIALYTGDLLADWFSDWCIGPRARMRQLYVLLLEKLLAWAVAARAYEVGLDAGRRILDVDCARERTHRQLMRLYARTGRRSDALRQYEACEAALEGELGVGPGRSTIELVEDIRAGQGPRPGDGLPSAVPTLGPSPLVSPSVPSPDGLTVVEWKLDRLHDRVSDLEGRLDVLLRTLEAREGKRNLRSNGDGTHR